VRSSRSEREITTRVINLGAATAHFLIIAFYCTIIYVPPDGRCVSVCLARGNELNYCALMNFEKRLEC